MIARNLNATLLTEKEFVNEINKNTVVEEETTEMMVFITSRNTFLRPVSSEISFQHAQSTLVSSSTTAEETNRRRDQLDQRASTGGKQSYHSKSEGES